MNRNRMQPGAKTSLFPNKAQTARASGNQPDHVTEVQEFLRAIAHERPDFPLIAVDGIYGPETAEVVKIFQKQEGLPVTGRVDKATWNALYRDFLLTAKYRRPPSGITPFPSAKVHLEPGDSGDAVIVLELMLNALARRFANMPLVEANGKYDEGTAKAVKEVQKKSGLPQTGILDRKTWELLAASYNSLH